MNSTDDLAAPTPGPWCLMGSESTRGWRDLTVCQQHMPFIRVCFLTSDGPNEANGRLIAAAPDLLALAKQYASECSGCDGSGHQPVTVNAGELETTDCPDCADIRAVINKAEGVENGT